MIANESKACRSPHDEAAYACGHVHSLGKLLLCLAHDASLGYYSSCKTTEAGAKWMARALNLGGATTNVK